MASTDPVRKYVDDVMTELARLTGVTYQYLMGGRSFAVQVAPPFLRWKYGSISHDEADTKGNIATEVQELIIKLQDSGATEDENDTKTRALKNQLLVACRNIAQSSFPGDPVQFGSFDWNEDANNVVGRALVGSVFVRVQVPDEADETVNLDCFEIVATAEYDDGTAEQVLDLTVCEWDVAFPTTHFNIGKLGSPAVAPTPGTPDPASMATFSQVNISAGNTVKWIHLHGIEDQGSGSLTVEVYKYDGATFTLLGSLTLNGGGGDFATATLVPSETFIPENTYLFAQLTAFSGAGGYDGITVDVHFV